MYYVITKNGVLSSRFLKHLNKKHKFKLKDNDFRILGNSKILNLTDKDITYLRDLHYMSQIPVENLYRKDIKPLILNIVQLVVSIMVYMSVIDLTSALQKAFGGG